jgi:hypothetical protein
MNWKRVVIWSIFVFGFIALMSIISFVIVSLKALEVMK